MIVLSGFPPFVFPHFQKAATRSEGAQISQRIYICLETGSYLFHKECGRELGCGRVRESECSPWFFSKPIFIFILATTQGPGGECIEKRNKPPGTITCFRNLSNTTSTIFTDNQEQ